MSSKVNRQPPALPAAVEGCLAAPPPRAGSFIVTIYGDVVEPRGEALWMGTLIEVCADHGISEGLVRTAVSRLVASGRLVGERQGRKSYYRLTQEARREFAAAARVLFAPPPVGDGWLIALDTGGLSAEHQAAGWTEAAGCAIAPKREDLPRPAGVLFSARPVAGDDNLRDFARRRWNLTPTEAAYRDFVERFRGAAEAVAEGCECEGATSLALRLRLVHEYRRVLLSDPRLPAAALPPDWPGAAARQLFVSLYLALAEKADRHVHLTFRDGAGRLTLESSATRARLDALRREFGAKVPVP